VCWVISSPDLRNYQISAICPGDITRYAGDSESDEAVAGAVGRHAVAGTIARIALNMSGASGAPQTQLTRLGTTQFQRPGPIGNICPGRTFVSPGRLATFLAGGVDRDLTFTTMVSS